MTRTWAETLPIMGESEAGKQSSRLERFIRARGRVTRHQLLRSGHFFKSELDEGLAMLASEDKIEILDADGSTKETPTVVATEVYRRIGEQYLGAKVR